jgi:hypothetical protein
LSDLKVDGIIASTGTNTALTLQGKGSGKVDIGDGALSFPDADGSANQVISTTGSGVLQFVTPASAGLNLIETITTTASSFDFETNINSTYDTYMISYMCIPATDGQLFTIQVGTGGTPTYVTANYEYAASHMDVSDTIITGSNSAAHIAPHSDRSAGNVATEGNSGTFFFHDPASTTSFKTFHGTGYIQDTASNGFANQFGGVQNATTAITAIRLKYASGDITGEASLWGLKRA